MKYDNELMINWLKISQVKGLGPNKIEKLVRYFGDIEKIFNAKDNELLGSRIFNESMLEEWNKLKSASSDSYLRIISQCQENKFRIMPIFDPDYPKKLKFMPYPPKTLFLAGDASLLEKKKIAIVGTRDPEPSAIKWAHDSTFEISKKGFVIVSGGAKGIDATAHKTAFEAGEKTICVFGTGLLNYYPPENKELFERIRKEGLLISEHLPNFPGSQVAFVQRNRITSGISDAVVLVASHARGGSMIQAKIAHEQRVPVFVPKLLLKILPNEGITQAIKEFGAVEVETAEDVLKKLETKGGQMKLG